MTVTIEDTKEVLVGDGATVAWGFNFRVFAPGDVKFSTTSIEGVDSFLEYLTDYTVVLNVDQYANPGGTVTTMSPVPKGVPIVVSRGLDFVRATHFTASIPPNVIEDELDRLTIYAQQLKEQLDRSLHVSAATQAFADVNLRNVPARRGKLIGFDEEGDTQLLEIVGGLIRGPQGVSRVSRVELSAPAVFVQSNNGGWSHNSTIVTFIWTADGVEELRRSITVTFDAGTGLFNAPVAADISSSGGGTTALRIWSIYNSVEDSIQLVAVPVATGAGVSDAFEPAWTGFSAAPVGDVSYNVTNGRVGLSIETAREGTSNSIAATWSAGSIPLAARPTADRVVPCMLRVSSTLVTPGQVTIKHDGGAVFAPFLVTAKMAVASDFVASGTKGLPTGWNVDYPL